jgi:hypothetical protein
MRIAYFIGVAILALVIFSKPGIVTQRPTQSQSAVKEKPPVEHVPPDVDAITDVNTIVMGPGSVMFVTPFGPCGTTMRLAPSLTGFNGVGLDGYIFTSHDPQETLVSALRWCHQWYQQEKANRDDAREIGQAWQQQHRNQERQKEQYLEERVKRENPQAWQDWQDKQRAFQEQQKAAQDSKR